MTASMIQSEAVDSPFQTTDLTRELWAERSMDSTTFAAIRRRALLEGCKWDPQVGDAHTLASFPLVLKSSVWRKIAAQAEQLTAETLAAEEEISRRPALLEMLGLPRALRAILASNTPLTPSAGRVMRFDFHPTAQGWRISEVNSDVPGGFTEASHFTTMMTEHFPNLRPPGNPSEVWTTALEAAAGRAGPVVLLSAPGYMEDHQVIAFLAARLRARGCRAYLAKPEQIVWRDGLAHLATEWYRGEVGAIFRFYQAEWLSRLARNSGWPYYFRGGKTPVSNPALAVISESKRFPLVWDRLSVPMPTWRALLPETRDPRDAPWSRDESWLLKTALCNTGDTVSKREWMKSRDWLRTRLQVHLSPGNWAAQRRFESRPISTPLGLRHACVGVFTINGRAAGAYTRLSAGPVIDFAATDVALLLETDE